MIYEGHFNKFTYVLTLSFLGILIGLFFFDSLSLNITIFVFFVFIALLLYIKKKVFAPLINVTNKLVTEIESETIKIKKKLYFDDLTDLRNRQALIDDTRTQDFVSIVLIDIDSFDNINELYGFSTGNKVLIETSNILKDFCEKEADGVYRVYGNSFAITNEHVIDFIKFNSFIEKLSNLFKNRAIKINDIELDIFIEITLGISIAQEEPLKSAGIALKKAKRNKLPYFIYNTEIDTKELIKNTMKWRGKISDSLNEDKVVPFFQAIFDRNKNIIKYECLMRIKEEDDKGNISYILPNEFLDVSIKTKQYLELTKKVITAALNTVPTTDKQISINIGFNDILNQDFRVFLEENISNLNEEERKKVVFEILESDHISDYTELDEFILEYRKMGIKIAIDDFGTGYSNFEHILKARPDYIKIDGSLIKNINNDNNSFEMVKSIIAFCKALDIKVIAEFIHNESVFETVKDMDVDEFQGYFLSEPSLNLDKF
jgi:diguanylate cyclase (GGDEF)-like protein